VIRSLYSSARRLVEAWGNTTAASVAFATLAAAWPDDVDIVIDAGLPDALEVPRQLVEQAISEVAGIPTATSVSPASHGNIVRLPDPEIAQIIGLSAAASAGDPRPIGLLVAVDDREQAHAELAASIRELDGPY
jgi:hypothetical protein